MSARRHVAAILAVMIILLCAPVAGDARRSPSPMVDKINKARRAHGVRPARYSPLLSRSSSRFAHYLAQTNQFSHASRIMASNRFSKLGEVLALVRGRRTMRGRTLAHWLRSPSHRAVLLSPAFRYVGAARVKGHFRGRPAVFWTVQLGRR